MHAGDQDLVVGQLRLLPHRPFMRVARVGGLDNERLRLGLDEDRRDFGKGDVVVVRPLVIAPADVDARAVGRHVAQRVVQHLDMEFRALEEIGFVEVLKAGVMRHRQVGAIELQHEPGLDDRLVFLLHRRRDGFDIGLVARVIGVALEHRHQTRRGRGHEPFDHRDLIECRAQIGEVLAQRLAVAPGDRADAWARRAVLAPVIRS